MKANINAGKCPPKDQQPQMEPEGPLVEPADREMTPLTTERSVPVLSGLARGQVTDTDIISQEKRKAIRWEPRTEGHAIYSDQT